MAIKSTITGGGSGSAAGGGTGRVNHNKADDRVYRRQVSIGTTADGTHCYDATNSHPLSSLVEDASIRTTDRYDWATGTMHKEKIDILSNAKANINTLKVRPVTNARHYEEPDCPWNRCQPAMATSAVIRKKKRGK